MDRYIYFYHSFLTGGFLYVLYKQKQKEQKELENAEKEKSVIPNEDV